MREAVMGFWFGAVLLALGLALLVRQILLRLRCAAYAVGKLEEEISPEGNARPVLRFSANGEQVSVPAGNALSRGPLGRPGREVEIRYNPDRPGQFCLSEDRRGWIGAWFCVCLGLALCVVFEFLAGPWAIQLPFGRFFQWLSWWMRYRAFK